MGYWYQVGLSWDWSPGTGFAMSYEVFNSLGNSISPQGGGGGLTPFSGTVNVGDNVTLSLYFSSGDVVMLAHDVNTGASAEVTYSAEGATHFVGQPGGDANSIGFFTGLMTEWYHGAPYYTNPLKVVYSTNASVTSGWLWMDEFNANDGRLVFAANDSALTDFTANPTLLQEFSYSGTTEYADGFEFVTGGGSNSTSTSTSTSTPTVTTTETMTATSTQTTTSIQTSTSTVTTTVRQPVTTTATSTQSTTITATSTSTAPPTTETTTQTTTQFETSAPIVSLPIWSYALMLVLLIAGMVIGYLVRGGAGPGERPGRVGVPDDLGAPDFGIPNAIRAAPPDSGGRDSETLLSDKGRR